MAGPEVMELGQGRLMSNSGRSGCLVQVQCPPPACRQDWQRKTDEAEFTCGLVSSRSPVGEERLGHMPGEGKAGSDIWWERRLWTPCCLALGHCLPASGP